MGLRSARPLLHLPYLVLFLQLKVDVEVVLFLPPPHTHTLFSKDRWLPHGPLMSLPLMHVSDLCQIGDTNFGAPPAAVTAAAAAPARLGAPISSGLSDLFDLTSGVGTLSGSYVAPKAVSPSPFLLAGAERGTELGWVRPPTELGTMGMDKEAEGFSPVDSLSFSLCSSYGPGF